jgi:hypothetical protein
MEKFHNEILERIKDFLSDSVNATKIIENVKKIFE